MNSSELMHHECQIYVLLGGRLEQPSPFAELCLLLNIIINIFTFPFTAVLNALVMITVKNRRRLRAHKSNITIALLATTDFVAELWRAKRVCGAPWVSKSTHPRKFGNHVTVHRPPAARPSAPQAYQCLLSHFLAALGAQEKADCTSMLSSIDSYQNRVSTDQYRLKIGRASCRERV